MRRRQSDQIISVIGSQLYQPIADMLRALLDRPYQKPDRVSSNHFEGGYSAALIVLLAIVVESFVQRDRYFYALVRPSVGLSLTIPQYMKTVHRYRRWAQLEDLFEVRNAIAHNHLWSIDFAIPPRGGRCHKGSSLIPNTHRLKAIPSSFMQVPRTKRLKFNLMPIRLDRTDVLKALNISLHALKVLSSKGYMKIPLINSRVGFRGRRVPFAQLEAEVRTVLGLKGELL